MGWDYQQLLAAPGDWIPEIVEMIYESQHNSDGESPEQAFA